MRRTPFERIQHRLQQRLPSDVLRLLPERWEKIGTVLVLRLPDELSQKNKERIAQTYAEVLKCTTVLQDTGGITGVYREPSLKRLYGSPHTETIHVENGIRYCLDPQRIMFSSGNMAERLRMATISSSRETVVDLFAGIGYFTLPLAVYSTPMKVFACEINPVSYEYLCKNITLNQVNERVEPLLGDNRTTAPQGCADRVILGYFSDLEVFLPVALNCLKNHRGVLHVHYLTPVEGIPTQVSAKVASMISRTGCVADVRGVHDVKSYAPGIHHVVVDVTVRR